MPARSTSRTLVCQSGFTLLEVIVALAILGLAIVASIQGFAGGLRLLKLAGDHQTATLLADQKLREALKLEEGHENGTEGPFSWERTTALVPAPDLTPDVTGPTGPKWRVYRVDVKVQWERRSVQLATLRTVPVEQTLVTQTGAQPGQPQTGLPQTGVPSTGLSQPGLPSSRTAQPPTTRP